MLYVTDAHAFAWYILDILPEKVDKIFKSVENGESTIFVPTIVLAECLYLIENNKIDLDFSDLLKRIEMRILLVLGLILPRFLLLFRTD